MSQFLVSSFSSKQMVVFTGGVVWFFGSWLWGGDWCQLQRQFGQFVKQFSDVWSRLGFLVYILPSDSICIVVSRKLIFVSLVSIVIFIVGWKLFKAVMKEFNSSLPCSHIENISSINCHHTSGLRGLFARNSVSILFINRIAQMGAHLVPIVVPANCSQNLPLKEKAVLVSMRCNSLSMIHILGSWLLLFSKACFTALIPLRCGILVQSQETSMVI